VTITAVADAGSTPPSVDVTVTSGVGTVMSSVALWRNDSSGRSLVRSQPSAGFDSRAVTDYECPYGESVTYDWEATYVSSFTSVWDETWASLASWTTDYGSWAVSAGTVHNTTGSGAQLSRSLTLGKYRYVVDGWTVGGSATGYIYFTDIASDSQTILRLTGGVLSVAVSPTYWVYTATTIDASLPFTVDVNSGTVSVTGTGGETTVLGDVQASGVYLQSNDAASSGYVVDNIEVFSYGASADIAETSSPLTLDAVDAWLIHPGTPVLSIPIIENSNDTATRLVEIGEIENATNATIHRILGSATPIPTTTGPRSDDTSTLTIETVTTDEAAAVRALLASDIPILIQIPPDWDLDFNCGFYQVGNVRTSRSDPIINSYRTFTLPLTKVQSPVVDVENTGWSYAAVAAEFATYSALMVTFATYADLASDTRS
jgi:hypothetical protein